MATASCSFLSIILLLNFYNCDIDKTIKYSISLLQKISHIIWMLILAWKNIVFLGWSSESFSRLGSVRTSGISVQFRTGILVLNSLRNRSMQQNWFWFDNTTIKILMIVYRSTLSHQRRCSSRNRTSRTRPASCWRRQSSLTSYRTCLWRSNVRWQ